MKIQRFNILVLIVLLGFSSCRDLTELNVNPNSPSKESANVNLLLSGVVISTARHYLSAGQGSAAGTMQYYQKDAWAGMNTSLSVGGGDWSGAYNNLRTINELIEVCDPDRNQFHIGVAKVMRALWIADLADFYGDAPYSESFKVNEGIEYYTPSYDSQKKLYVEVLKELDEAATLLSQPADAYPEPFYSEGDVIFEGDVTKWHKFANSLRLRYLMRLSNKTNDFPEDIAKTFAKIVAEGNIMESVDDEATMPLPGTDISSSWPNNTIFDSSNGSEFARQRACSTLVEALRKNHDPRIGVWFAKVEIPTKWDSNLEYTTSERPDTIVEINGKKIHFVNPYEVDSAYINTNEDYVGLPPALYFPAMYNYYPSGTNESKNPFVSRFNEMYKDATGDLLRARVMPYSEVCFILSEAVLRGWISGSAEDYYNNGVKASLETWGVEDGYDDLINQAGAKWDGTLQRIIEQKWISFWTLAHESFLDYRRTGFPALELGESIKYKGAMPIRASYPSSEKDMNGESYDAALQNLEITQYSNLNDPDNPADSKWSKPWIVQGTGKPW